MKNVSKANFKRSIERYLCFLCENSELYAEYAYENTLTDLMKANKRFKKFAERMSKKHTFPLEKLNNRSG
jgi:hypothetical protein